MNKDLLRYPVVVEVGQDGATTIYYSRKVSGEVDRMVEEVGADSSPPRPYCHECFSVPCACGSSGIA